jgi:hypothetical protein
MKRRFSQSARVRYRFDAGHENHEVMVWIKKK